MQLLSRRRTGLVQTVAVSSLTLAATGLLALVLAYWTWQWFAPRPAPAAIDSTVPAVNARQAQQSGNLFGSVRIDSVNALPAIGIKLLGVIADAGSTKGYALLQLSDKQTLAVHSGDSISPGVQVIEIHEDHVVIDRNGNRETLALPAKKPAREIDPYG